MVEHPKHKSRIQERRHHFLEDLLHGNIVGHLGASPVQLDLQ